MPEVQVYKLVTGEEVIATIDNETDNSIILKKPRVIAIGPGPNGQMSVTLIPLLASNPEGDFKLEKSTVVGQALGAINKELKKGYLEQTSGIHLV